MRRIDIISSPTPDERSELLEFVESVAARTASPPLSDHLRLDLRAGGADGFVAVRVAETDGTIAYAQISAAHDGSSLEVVVEPAVADQRRVHDDVADTAVDAFRRRGGGRLSWWLDDPDPTVLELAARLGLAPVRELHEMRRPMPTERHAEIETRSFRPDDADAWLQVNNRAFADHGEQGGWTHETLALRQAEDWFDPDGFRLHERDGRLAGFCWTKLHHDQEPTLGEIYVIAVDPDFHGLGLGSQLTLAGLDSMSARGVTVANLYVDADNTAAVRLYDRLGFTIHRTRIACAGDLGPLAR